MARKFKIDNLPNDVWEKVSCITWNEDYAEELDINCGDESCCSLGWVDLEDEWCFEWDGSHQNSFTSRKDLIDIVRNNVIPYDEEHWCGKES